MQCNVFRTQFTATLLSKCTYIHARCVENEIVGEGSLWCWVARLLRRLGCMYIRGRGGGFGCQKSSGNLGWYKLVGWKCRGPI